MAKCLHLALRLHRPSQRSMQEVLGKYPCFDCGKPGQWAGDATCPSPGAGLGRKSARKPKSVKVVESLNTEHVVDVCLQEPQEVNEVLTVSKAYPNMSIGED